MEGQPTSQPFAPPPIPTLRIERWRRSLLLALLVVIGLVYFAFPNRSFHDDAIAYAWDIEHDRLFHPHHLLFNVLGWLVYKGINQLTTMRAIYALQYMNITFSLVGIVLLYCLVRRSTSSTLIALWSAAMLAVSHGWWKYSVAGETYIIPMALLLLVVVQCEQRREAMNRRRSFLLSLWIGALCTLMALMHQSHVLFFLPLLVLLTGNRSSWRNTGTVALVFVAGVFVTYLLVYYQVTGRWSVSSMLRWSLSYAITPLFEGAYGTPIAWSHFPRFLGGFASLITAQKWPGFLRFIVVEGLFLMLCVYGSVRGIRGSGPPVRLVGFLLSWIVVYALFAFWWEPGNIEFLMPLCPPLLWLTACSGQVWMRCHPRRGLFRGAAVCALLFAADVNFFQNQRREHEARKYAVQERLLLQVTRPGDIVVTPRALSKYLEYFHGRRLNQIKGAQWGRQYGVGTISEYLDGLSGQIEASLARGKTVYTLDYPLRLGPPLKAASPLRAGVIKSITLAEIRAFYARYEIELVHHPMGTIARIVGQRGVSHSQPPAP